VTEAARPQVHGSDNLRSSRKESNSQKTTGVEGGILSKHPKKFPVVMVKSNFFVVNERKVEKRFCQC